MFHLIEEINKKYAKNNENLKRKSSNILFSEISRDKLIKPNNDLSPKPIFKSNQEDFLNNKHLKNAYDFIDATCNKRYEIEKNTSQIIEEKPILFNIQEETKKSEEKVKIRNENGRFGRINNITKK